MEVKLQVQLYLDFGFLYISIIDTLVTRILIREHHHSFAKLLNGERSMLFEIYYFKGVPF